MSAVRRTFASRAFTSASLLLTTSFAVLGCASNAPVPVAAPAVSVAGNWQFNSATPSAAKPAQLSGAMTGTSTAFTGVLHADSASACINPNTSFAVKGSTNAQNVTTITGSNVAGGTLTIVGTLAATGQSLTSATYNLVGGTCAFPAAATANATVYSNITGTYAGSFVDPNPVISLTGATLTQSPAGDTNGNFQLTGSATIPNNPCFANAVNISSSQITGGSFQFTYSDTASTNQVAVSGTFSPDGKTLTVTNWTLSGPCGSDSGTGTMSR